MKTYLRLQDSLPRQAAILILASAIGLPAWAHQANPQAPPDQNAPAAAAQNQPQDQNAAADQNANSTAGMKPAREGFWGRINPMARKKWVKKQIDPINDRLNELDEVNARNAQQIKDVDQRAQAGIQKAQAAAEAANQTATAASQQAETASNAAQQASTHVTQIGDTVNGLDQYHQITDVDVKFRPGTTTLTEDSKQDLDKLAASLTGRDGYILEMDAQAPGNGSLGIQRSQQLAEAVQRYLVVDHQIPIYRMHAVALGNEQVAQADTGASPNQENGRPERVRTRSVHVRLMENSLAAQGPASPQGAAPSTGTVQQ